MLGLGKLIIVMMGSVTFRNEGGKRTAGDRPEGRELGLLLGRRWRSYPDLVSVDEGFGLGIGLGKLHEVVGKLLEIGLDLKGLGDQLCPLVTLRAEHGVVFRNIDGLPAQENQECSRGEAERERIVFGGWRRWE